MWTSMDRRSRDNVIVATWEWAVNKAMMIWNLQRESLLKHIWWQNWLHKCKKKTCLILKLFTLFYFLHFSSYQSNCAPDPLITHLTYSHAYVCAHQSGFLAIQPEFWLIREFWTVFGPLGFLFIIMFAKWTSNLSVIPAVKVRYNCPSLYAKSIHPFSCKISCFEFAVGSFVPKLY